MFALYCHGRPNQLCAMCSYGMVFIALHAASDGTTDRPCWLICTISVLILIHSRGPLVDCPSKWIKHSFLISNHRLELERTRNSEGGRKKAFVHWQLVTCQSASNLPLLANIYAFTLWLFKYFIAAWHFFCIHTGSVLSKDPQLSFQLFPFIPVLFKLSISQCRSKNTETTEQI